MSANDRGPARYFHGREDIIWRFNRCCERALEHYGGDTFLIQGAPGAGKTALLYELIAQAGQDQWHVAMITPSAFMDYKEMVNALGTRIPPQTQSEIDLMLSSAGRSYEPPSASAVPKILRTAVPGRPGLLLVLDEAQTLSSLVHAPEKPYITSILQAIHNRWLKRPVILLAAGVSRTRRAFGDLGIARFTTDCRRELGRDCCIPRILNCTRISRTRNY